MSASLKELGEYVRAAREDTALSQEELAAAVVPATNRTAVALLEQGRRLPPPEALRSLCEHLHVPSRFWKPLLTPEVRTRSDFEDALAELAGRRVSLRQQDEHTAGVAHQAVASLFNTGQTEQQLYAAFAGVLVNYAVRRPTPEFFRRYLGTPAFASVEAFDAAVRRYQHEAIRLYSSFGEAYTQLSQAAKLDAVLEPLATRPDSIYRERTAWEVIEDIEEERLPDLGYISAARVRKEQTERESLASFLNELADGIEKGGRDAVSGYTEKRRRKIGSFLRQFDSALHHDLMSPLFAPDPDQLRREAARLAPKAADDITRMEETQATGMRNLARYLAADFMDVYVATSMRSDADFASVTSFVNRLFSHSEVHPLKLRYFNPTQSWIEDRVAKGLVEALMLRRADFTIYMAQKTDSFGKDSEASVALGQGKPVVVYVPKLFVKSVKVDSEALGLSTRADLQQIVEKEASGEDAEVDETTDHQALLSQVLSLRLQAAKGDVLAEAAREHWADFDLYGEASRIHDDKERASYRAWLDRVVRRRATDSPDGVVRAHFIGILVATATNFENRAKLFREVHPLALQVILSTGVLNGILVVRSIDSCAHVLANLVRNDLDVELRVDDHNYRLVEKSTGSTVRVISRHTQIANAFEAFYERS